ncbi:MAG: RNA 2',3'-cyclic phosphodiesterase [Acidobacteria bacterium]|nr:RNA 2',3'-cyclic phosphodiesterase [Acidobacteriota bacterium]
MPEARSAQPRAADGPAVRAFLAIPRDPAWGESAARLVEALRPTSPDAAWTRPESWHVTIKFLGDGTPEALEDFSRALAPAASAVRSGALFPGGATVFPSRGPARVLGLGFARSASLEDLEGLASAAEREARRLGLKQEDRPFHPHVTLARLPSRWPRDAVERFRRVAGEWKVPAFRAAACVLFGSRLGPRGAVHIPLAEWAFRADGAGATA